MVETDWREILSFSQRELGQADKEKLCDSISWMEADDIELNFSDLKTLFRLAQDILKHKNEQVNNLLGQLETVSRKNGKKKAKSHTESPASAESVLETIAHQEELILANKEILEQLYNDIAQLEGKKSKLESGRAKQEDSDSSRNALSEMNDVVQLENEVAMKNRHIRKLLSDVKLLEEEISTYKEKTLVLKDKLTEATQLINNLTEQLLQMKNEGTHLKDILGKSEQVKAKLSCEIDALRKELFNKESARENIYEEIKSKAQHWKHIARTKKSEVETLSSENKKLKNDLHRASKSASPKVVKSNTEELKIKELQDKLSEASNEIDQSANLINLLRTENKQLKGIIEETQDYPISENRNESDEGKERILINKLKEKVKTLTTNLQGAEEMIAARERELAEIASELQLVQSDEGINALLDGLKHKKRELKVKDEGIKSLVQEINNYSQQVNDLQLENETLRQTFNVPTNEAIHTGGVVQKYRELEDNNSKMCREIRRLENKLVNVEIDNRRINATNKKLARILSSVGYDQQEVERIMDCESDDNNMPRDGGGESLMIISKQEPVNTDIKESDVTNEAEMKVIMEENDGLRKGLQEILDFLKDNSTTSSGILALECPSLEALLRSLDARHAAGWFAPHMSTILELRQVMGGKDALLKALHEARKETFDVMSRLSIETQKSSQLEKKLQERESKECKDKKENATETITNFGEFGSWIAESDQNNIDISNEKQMEEMISKGNVIYEGQLKKGLEYFHQKFKLLFDQISIIGVQAADDHNKWSLQKEQYEAQIENLKGQIQQQEIEEISENSPGLISLPSPIYLQRKCKYLEDSYRYLRTMNENLKNENMEAKKEIMYLTSEFEIEVQRLILSIVNLTDKLRNSVPIELFWKLSSAFSQNLTKYRKVLEDTVRNKRVSIDLLERLEKDKLEIINKFRHDLNGVAKNENKTTENILSTIEESVLKKQLSEICLELDTKNMRIEYLEGRNTELQEDQSKIIENSISSATKQDFDLLKSQIQILAGENRILKEKSQHISSQLDIALLQLQEHQQKQLSNDMEVNILRHQILDLQSASDNKAVVARLSGEVLVAHLQVTESNKKIERLNSALIKEKELRAEAEEMLNARQKVFDVYSFRYESKFKYIFKVMQVLRKQYQGSIPLTSIENFLNKMEDITRESKAVNEKLQEIEDLRANLMSKHSVFDQILDVSRNKCIIEGDSCPHKIKTMMMKSTHDRAMEHLCKKLKSLDIARDEIAQRYNDLERTLILVNQGFEKSKQSFVNRNHSEGEISASNLELEDIQSDEDSSSRRSITITLPKPQILKPLTNDTKKPATNLPINTQVEHEAVEYKINNEKPKGVDVQVQTIKTPVHQMKQVYVQTADDRTIIELKQNMQTLNKTIEKQAKELAEALTLVQQRTNENLVLSTDKLKLEAKYQSLKNNYDYKEKLNGKMQIDIDEMKNEITNFKALQIAESNKMRNAADNETKSLLMALKQLENDKIMIAAEYKELLNNEREEYSRTLKELNVKNMELQSKLDRKGSDSNGHTAEALKEVVGKYTTKIVELEDNCFKLQSELDECRSELTTYQSEADRWKDLATERLTKMEQLNAQLGERHHQEVESYKAENQHWLSQLSDTQREHLELRSRLTEQKTIYIKQLADKDGQIEHLRSVINNLKTQVMSLQTMISVNDPSFDLSAIVEVEEASDVMSQPGSDRLEIKYHCSVTDVNDEFGRIGNSSTTIWQEPVIERLRRDKQLAGKQNAILRRQIKALAARERRSRLDAQNLRNQVFRISTSGSKVATAESAALHNKITSLQAQLISARRDNNSSIALWDKWKRAQQCADRWQARFEEKSQEVKKLEACLNLSKSGVNRLEREKRILVSKLSQDKNEHPLSLEKQESEMAEKASHSTECASCLNAPPLSNHALLERVQAQQRRIVALEVAEKGNERLVSEYEKALAENTSLKGTVLKLESTLLEAQIRTPCTENKDSQPELEYWKNYCEMLKEENVQLNVRLSASEVTPTTAHQHRVNDMEQTILTLRGLVSKLQAEQKSSSVHRKPESRPSSGRSASDKSRGQLESHRIEIANLKRSLQEKDLLLERSKEMLNIAAEREDDLLRENAFLRRQLEELTNPKPGFLSA